MTERYVMCIHATVDEDDPMYPLALTLHKVYRVLPPEPLDTPEDLRLIDDGCDEDYLYPSEWFTPVELTETGAQSLERVLA